MMTSWVGDIKEIQIPPRFLGCICATGGTCILFCLLLDSHCLGEMCSTSTWKMVVAFLLWILAGLGWCMMIACLTVPDWFRPWSHVSCCPVQSKLVQQNQCYITLFFLSKLIMRSPVTQSNSWIVSHFLRKAPMTSLAEVNDLDDGKETPKLLHKHHHCLLLILSQSWLQYVFFMGSHFGTGR